MRTGRCLCGQVRYAFGGPVETVRCHCRMCRRASGAAFSTWVTLLGGTLIWTAAPPRWHRASVVARRAFCGACGSRLAMAYDDTGEVSVALGTLDDPQDLRPVRSIWVSDRLPDMAVVDRGLPLYGGDAPA